jgi:hypothetical protein
MLGLLASMNYKPWYALSEFVDNAVASRLANASRLTAAGSDVLRVTIDMDRGLGTIIITDNAAGIAGVDIGRAFKSAEPPPDASGLSQFGIGMKAAACWYARKFTVVSTALGEDVRRRVTFDVPAIVAANQEQLPVEVEPAPVDEHGTTLILSELHRPIPQGGTLPKIRRYLGSIYRGYLGPELLLEVRGEPVEYARPAILCRPRWDAPRDAPAVEWQKEITISLPGGRTITGWAALREKGSTKEAGLALLFRGKVVVGAGAGAGEPEDLYRPTEIFGGGNSFVSQRLFGELDVSVLRVTHSKDAIIWDGYEDTILAELRKQLDSEPLPLLRMGTNYRVNEQGPDITRQVRTAVDTTVAAAGQTELPGVASEDDEPKAHEATTRPPTVQEAPSDESSSLATRPLSSSVRELVEAPFTVRVGETDVDLLLSVSDSADDAWIRLVETGGAYHIRVARDHPFMRSFAHLPNQQIEPVLRLAVALGVAEVAARRAGANGASQVRAQLNVALRGSLGSSLRLPNAPEDTP